MGISKEELQRRAANIRRYWILSPFYQEDDRGRHPRGMLKHGLRVSKHLAVIAVLVRLLGKGYVWKITCSSDRPIGEKDRDNLFDAVAYFLNEAEMEMISEPEGDSLYNCAYLNFYAPFLPDPVVDGLAALPEPDQETAVH